MEQNALQLEHQETEKKPTTTDLLSRRINEVGRWLEEKSSKELPVTHSQAALATIAGSAAIGYAFIGTMADTYGQVTIDQWAEMVKGATERSFHLLLQTNGKETVNVFQEAEEIVREGALVFVGPENGAESLDVNPEVAQAVLQNLDRMDQITTTITAASGLGTLVGLYRSFQKKAGDPIIVSTLGKSIGNYMKNLSIIDGR